MTGDQSKRDFSSRLIQVMVYLIILRRADLFVFANALGPTLNVMKTIDIIPEFHFKSGVNFVRLNTFVVGKTNNDSLVIFHQ
jgi:hypothetical protein